MRRKVTRLALSGVAVLGVAALVGCSAQSQPGGNAALGTAANGGPEQAAMINQGRFPTPGYTQEQEPSYALTGQEQSNWILSDRTVNAGNARLIIPATP